MSEDTTLIDETQNKGFYSKIVVTSSSSSVGLAPKCKRAKGLHIKSSNFNSSTGKTETTYYGNLNSGSLNTGDAFDCDVNGDEIYDPSIERFYYLSNMDDDTAVLIYYSEIKDGIPQARSSLYGEDTVVAGPTYALKNLPSYNQWKNVRLKNEIRNIYYENNEIAVENFNYEGYAARLPSRSDITNACYENGTLVSGKCDFLSDNYNSTLSMILIMLEDACTTEYKESGREKKFSSYYSSSIICYPARLGEGEILKPVIEVSLSDIEI